MSEANLKRSASLAARGDRAAFAELYEEFSPRVYRLCRRLLRQREAAEDATSEVFLRAQRALDSGTSYDAEQPFDRWLLSIAGHFCVDQLRRGGLEKRWFTDPEAGDRLDGEGEVPNLIDRASQSWTSSTAPSALERMITREHRDTLRAAMEKLSERYRVILVLRYDSEMNYEQIAAALGLKRNLVATLIYRAKAELRRILVSGGEPAV